MDSRRLSSGFKLAVFVLLGLTLLFAVAAVSLSVGLANPTSSQSSAESWLYGASSSSFTAMCGLFTGKVL